jgi:uncharacterized repeat protein (TIGR01451 family)
VVTPQVADLSLTKIVDNAAPQVGSNVTFTLTLSNAGPNSATNVSVTDLLPAGLTYVSDLPSQGTYVSGTGVWTVGTLASGASATLQIVATVSTSGAKSNYAQVSASDQYDPDSVPGNNSTTEDDDDTVVVTPISGGTVIGHLFMDTNGNGTQDIGEPNLPNIDVVLTDQFGGIHTVSSNGNGDWTANYIPAGTVTVDVNNSDPDMPAGAIQTAGTDPQNVTVNDGLTTDAGSDGYALPSTIFGLVFIDTDNDGIKDAGEGPIQGVRLDLSGVTNLGQVISATVYSAADGSYSFPNLLPGTYSVTETQPSGYLDGLDAKGGIVIPGSKTTDIISGINLSGGINTTNNNFGELPPARLTGYIYQDVNNNGIKDAGEAGIQGAQVRLTGTDDIGQLIDLVFTTPAGGYYSFLNLRPGTYSLAETQPTGWVDGKDTLGTQGSGTVTNDLISAITLGVGINGDYNNFGELAPFVQEVTNRLSFTRCGLVYNRKTKLYSEDIVLQNTSATAITGTIQLEVQILTGAATLANGIGTSPNGHGFIIINIASLAPGGTVTVTCQFSNPSNNPFTYGLRAWSGQY